MRVVHVNAPGVAQHSKRRAIAAVFVLIVFPGAVAGYYWGYNVGLVSVYVTDDAITDFLHLNITFSEVQVRTSGALTGAPWSTIAITRATIDLVELHSNIHALVAQAKLHAGAYSQLRLVVERAEGELKGGDGTPIFIPSGELKTDSPFTVTAQGEVNLALRLLLVQTANQYSIRPVFAGAAPS